MCMCVCVCVCVCVCCVCVYVRVSNVCVYRLCIPHKGRPLSWLDVQELEELIRNVVDVQCHTILKVSRR